MCGLIGLVPTPDERDPGRIGEWLPALTDTLQHRGPDAVGNWVEPHGLAALGFRRLSIIDLSELGHQPMHSASGRYTIVFNGEVYNHESLRQELLSLGACFRGRSDTEVMLAACEAWGVRNAVQRFRGMFGIALWDAQRRRLFLARDRMGIKPLYLARTGRGWLFASELKPILTDSRAQLRLSSEGVRHFVSHLFTPAPGTLLEDVEKVVPGGLYTIDPETSTVERDRYWRLLDVVRAGSAERAGGAGECTDGLLDRVESTLRESVRLRLQADVPVGAFLSGGIDSSLVTALAAQEASGPLKTFTVGFGDAAFDESVHARAVAEVLDTDHTEITIAPSELLALVPRLAWMFDEPVADPSQIPTYLISEVARREVTVALSGDGGDELFAGYNRYRLALQLSQLRESPGLLRDAVLGTARAAAATPGLAGLLQRGLGVSGQHSLAGRLGKARAFAGAGSPAEAYVSLLAPGLSDGEKPDPTLVETYREVATVQGLGDLERMLAVDQQTYLVDDLLLKVDRASMATALEARVPILDQEMVALSWQLPRSCKLQGQTTKYALRRVLERHVPREIIERPKMGFTVPVAAWLRGPLRSWADELVGDTGDSLREAGIAADREWEAFLESGEGELRVWAILSLLAWIRHWELAGG